ncbi:D5-type cyclin [Tripterygium wilfordii]|uniref:B-like cyclin n=1 Tax=Tripterygium wilfordii TaxID=458696 RepID=A0A7J7CVV2_TRIWF|nr:cyclin-D5-1-like [Tripterygium wilfordii]KAF5738252.1 D5-type cyclin [Tripterygium wilfordii]
MEGLDDSLSLSSLLCHENEEAYFNGQENETDYMSYLGSFGLGSEDEEEYIEGLIRREDAQFDSKCHVSPSNDSAVTVCQSSLKCARLESIEWILNTRAIFGFHFNTVYISVNYFDRFLSKRSIDDGKYWAFRLLSIACLSLAVKMEEYKVPALSEFPVEGYYFESKSIQRMELLVLNTLEWKMGLITPFPYLNYLIHKIGGESKPPKVGSGAVELIVAMIKEINLIDHRPSIIAVAAIFAASDGQLSQKSLEHKMNSLSLFGSLENEQICFCYNLMLEIEMRKSKAPISVISPPVSSMHSSSTDAVENTFTSRAGVKRSLTFSSSDQSCPVKKINRQ